MNLLLIEPNAAPQTTLRRSFERRGALVTSYTDGEHIAGLEATVNLPLSRSWAPGTQVRTV